MGSLTHRIAKVAALCGDDPQVALAWFYSGLALTVADPVQARAFLQQIEREIADADGAPAESIEVDMRQRAASIREFLAKAAAG